MQFHKREHISRVLESWINASAICSSPRLVAMHAQHGAIPLDELILDIQTNSTKFQSYSSVTVDEAVAACRYSFTLSQMLVLSPTPAVALNFQLHPSILTVGVKGAAAKSATPISVEKLRVFTTQLSSGFYGTKNINNVLKIEKINQQKQQQQSLVNSQLQFKIIFNRPESALVFWRAVKYVPLMTGDGQRLYLDVEAFAEPFAPQRQTGKQKQPCSNTAGMRGGANANRNRRSQNNNSYNNKRNASVSHRGLQIESPGFAIQQPNVAPLKISRRQEYMQVAPLMIENRLNINVTQ